MKKIIFAFLLMFNTFAVIAQEDKNIADLDFLYQAIQQTPSYKDQLKGDKKYQQLYENIRKDLKTTDDFEVFQKLAQLISPLRDNHLGFWRRPDSGYNYVPHQYQIDSISTVSKYINKAKDSIEGVYQSGKIKYVVRLEKGNEYKIIDLSTGNLTGTLYKNLAGSYDMMQFMKYPYAYSLIRNIKLSNQLLIGSNYYKAGVKAFYNILSRKEKYEYKVLEEQVGYLSLGTFNSSDKEIKTATDFFNQVKSTINVKNLIVDVRNNFGGGYKNSRQFITFLKNYPGKIYILQNGYTVSNAEQFIIELKGRGNIKTLGETTKGTITYGSNYGKTLTLPSGKFLFYPTDMGGSKKELAFESIGVKPDIILNPFTEDWVLQTLKYIKAND